MKKKLFLLLPMLLVFFCFASCGGDDPIEDSDGTETPADTIPSNPNDTVPSGDTIPDGPRTFSITNKTITLTPPYEVSLDLIINDTHTDTYTFTSSNTDVVSGVINNKTIVTTGLDGTATITVATSDGSFSEKVVVTVEPIFNKMPYNEPCAIGTIRSYEEKPGQENTNSQGTCYVFFRDFNDMQIQYYVTTYDESYSLWYSLILIKNADKYEKYARAYMNKHYTYKGFDSLDPAQKREVYTIAGTGKPEKEIYYVYMCEGTEADCQLQITFHPSNPTIPTETVMP